MQFFSSKQFRVTIIWVKKYSNLEKNKPPCFTAGPQRSDTFQNLILGYAEHFDPGNKACDCNCIASAINNYQKLMLINIYANVYIYIYMYRCMYIYMCVCIHICMCNMCVYIYFWQSKKPHILIDWLFGMWSDLGLTDCSCTRCGSCSYTFAIQRYNTRWRRPHGGYVCSRKGEEWVNSLRFRHSYIQVSRAQRRLSFSELDRLKELLLIPWKNRA